MINTYGWMAIGILSLLVAVQGIITLYLMLYTWMRPERLEEARSPKNFAAPMLKFTALLPARHEQAVHHDVASASAASVMRARRWTAATKTSARCS